MHKSVNKTKDSWGYMESLALHTVAPIVHWEDNTSFISVVEAKMVTPRVKQIDILVCSLLEQFYNGIFVANYDNSSVMLTYMCIKPCPGTIISWSNKLMIGFRFCPNSDT